MAFRRGFKAEVDRLVVTTRGGLGVGLHDRLDPASLAASLDIEIRPLTGLKSVCPEDVDHLTVVDTSAFSGTLLERDGRRCIFVNDAHTLARQANTIAHECSHVILGHMPKAFTDGFRHFDNDIEREADLLGECLLVPTPAVVPVYRRLKTIDAAADHFGVSRELMRKRYNLSGAKQIIERSRAKRGQR